MKYSALSKYRSELMGMAMLWVMLFHAGDLDLGLPLLNDLKSVGFGGVDIFILLSGMGLAMSLARREQPLEEFLSRRARRVLPAYFVVMLPYTVFLILRGRAALSTLFWNSALLSYWVRAAGAFNWYIFGIMAFYCITPFLFRRLRRSAHRELLTAGGILLGLGLCQLLEWSDELGWSYLDVFMRLPVLLLGLLIGLYVREERPLTVGSWAFWGLMLAAGLVYGSFQPKLTELGFLFMLCHAFLFTSVPMCLALCAAFEHLPLGLLRRGLRVVGENSLEIYLFNVSLFAETALLRQFLSFGPTNRLYYLLTFAANIALGILLHRAVAWGMGHIEKRKTAHTNDRAGA